MIPYYILLFLPLVYYLYARNGRINIESMRATEKAQNTISAFFLIFFFMLAFRGLSCGVDLPNYQYFYNVDVHKSFSEVLADYRIEILFHLLNTLISCVFDNFQFYLFVVALICIIPLLLFYIKNADLPYLCIILFVTFAPFPMFFSGLRQAIALSFVPAAYYFCKKKQLLFFLGIVLLATGFHQSAMIMLLMYPVFNIRIAKNWLWIIIPLLVMILVFNDSIYSFLIPFIGERYFSRYGEIVYTGAYSVVLALFVFSFMSIYLPNNDLIDNELNGLRNLLFFCTALQCFAPVNSIAMRINYYYLLFIPVVVPNILTRSKIKYSLISLMVCIGMITVLLVYFYYNAYFGSDILEIYPYVPFW